MWRERGTQTRSYRSRLEVSCLCPLAANVHHAIPTAPGGPASGEGKVNTEQMPSDCQGRSLMRVPLPASLTLAGLHSDPPALLLSPQALEKKETATTRGTVVCSLNSFHRKHLGVRCPACLARHRHHWLSLCLGCTGAQDGAGDMGLMGAVASS